jgi:hypothetical protein
VNSDWYPGIRAFCEHWRHAPMLQQTFDALEREFAGDSDGCIDASKALVEVACQVVIANLDDPLNPQRPSSQNPDFGEWVSTAVRLLRLSEVRDEAFKKLISQHHKLTTTLGDLRNKAGTLSHGKDGFIEKLAAHHRRSALLAADAIVTFLHTAYLERDWDPVRSLEPYDRFHDANAVIDRFASLSAETDEDGLLQVTTGLPDGDELLLVVEPSRLLFGVDRQAYKSALTLCREAEASLAVSGDGSDDSEAAR